MIYLSEADVRKATRLADVIDAVERAFVDRANGLAIDQPRRRTRLPGGHLHIMQGASTTLGYAGYKAYYVRPEGRTCLTQLIDLESGRLAAIVECDWLGQQRTAAASVVAARRLACRDSRVLAVFGAGRHAAAHVEAFCAALPIERVQVFSRDPDRRHEFCTRLAASTGRLVTPAASADAALADAQIVVTATRGGGAVFDGSRLEPGQLVVAIGVNALDRHEVDLETVRRAALVVVDSREAAAAESGDLLPAWEQGLVHWESLADLGDVLLGRAGRQSDSDVILFESHGMAILDIYSCASVLRTAESLGLGRTLPFDG